MTEPVEDFADRSQSIARDLIRSAAQQGEIAVRDHALATGAAVLADITDWTRRIEAAKRVIVCEPHLVRRVQDTIDAAGTGGLYTVQGSPACPEGTVLIIDPSAWTPPERPIYQPPVDTRLAAPFVNTPGVGLYVNAVS